MTETNTQTVNNSLTVNNGLENVLLGNNATKLGIFYSGASPELISLNWIPLCNYYKSNGFVTAVVDMPVADAFRDGGFDIDSKTLDEEEIDLLMQTMHNEGDIEVLKDCLRWGRLYGGGLVMVNCNQQTDTPFNPATIYNKDVEFYALDRWQCMANGSSMQTAKTFTLQDLAIEENSLTIDKSRLFIFTGKNLPYYLRNQLQGWGASVLESVVPQLDQYLKANRVILELLDEAKIDILKIMGMADLLLSADGEQAVKKRVEIASAEKNYKSTLVMDKEDEYEQKQIHFGSIDSILEKIFLLICSSLRIPYSKIFGKGANGLGTGADLDIENYNAMVTSDIRVPAYKILREMIKIRCYQLFGRDIPDLVIKWKPLRVLSDIEEQQIRTNKINSYVSLLQTGVLNKKQVAEQLNKDEIILFSEEELENLDNDNFEDLLNNE